MADLALIEAVKSGGPEVVKALLKGGAEVNQRDEQGWTPLNFAAGKGDLTLVKILVENGADIFKTGRDLRTPYDIALAAGRVEVVEYLRNIEDQYPGENPARPKPLYCKAYHLCDLRAYPAWAESRIVWKESMEQRHGDNDEPLVAKQVVFIHQNFTVTESMYHNEKIIFNRVDAAWREFCADSLRFKVPDDMDLIAPNEEGVRNSV
jgi:hypothetical protein